jgi:uncharacterized iron-regulated membrane protein
MAMRPLRLWDLLHRWTSLVCTLFVVMLGITGLPLIFHDEINSLLGKTWHSPPPAAGMPAGDLDRVMASAHARFPGRTALFVSHEPQKDDPLWFVTFGPSSSDKTLVQAAVDARTGQVIAEPDVGDSGVMGFLLKLHVQMFAGTAGELFLGCMGVLLVISIVSGVVLYPSFMRHLSFGDLRNGRQARIRWLDLHNFTGMITLAWLLIAGITGAVNSFATLILNYWQNDQIAHLTQSYKEHPPMTTLGSLQQAMQTARARAPGLAVQFVAFPGSSFSTPYDYGIYMRGSTEATAKQYHPVFVDASTGTITATPQLPWYIVALVLSEPLHFGDYGGLPLKLIWALLDGASLAVVGTGLYLYLVRPRRRHDPRLRDLSLVDRGPS